LSATKVKSRQRKLDWKELEKDVKQNPESKLSDRYKKIGVNPTAIFYALKKMKITRKKKQLRYREINREERIKYYHKLRNLIKQFGSKSLVFIDKLGF
jgi:transposase